MNRFTFALGFDFNGDSVEVSLTAKTEAEAKVYLYERVPKLINEVELVEIKTIEELTKAKVPQYYWNTPQGKPKCLVIERTPTKDGPDCVIIELAESIDGNEFMQAGQRKVTTSMYLNGI